MARGLRSTSARKASSASAPLSPSKDPTSFELLSPRWIKSLKPAARASIRRTLQYQLNRVEGRQAAQAAERRAEAETNQALDHDAENTRCASDIFHWFDTWVWTYDPRLIGQRRINPETGKTEKISPYIPMTLWAKQRQAVQWILDLLSAQEEGVWEKSRDAGASYIVVAVCIWLWLYEPGFKATFGSRDADLVDSRDNPDSLFEKARIILRRLPEWMMPIGFSWRANDNANRLVNPQTGATITGEAGEEMGRGGRSTLFLVDEAAKVPRAEKVEAAVSANADCIIWVSSANGPGNLFYRKVMALPPKQKFRLHYSDDPRKTAEWVAKKKEGMDPVNWAAEYEIDYTASIEGICIPAGWVAAAQRLQRLVPDLPRPARGVAGVDIGGGRAKSVVVPKHGPIVSQPSYRQEADTTGTAYWALEVCEEEGCDTLNFDAPGVGAGVASTLRLTEKHQSVTNRIAVNTGVPPSEDRVWPDELTSKEKFGNLKAELWWLARTAFQKTYWHVLSIEDPASGHVAQPLDELVALPPDPTMASQLSMVRWFRNEAGKIVIEKKEQLQRRGVPSPDFADALILAFLEPPDDGIPQFDLSLGFNHRPNPWRIGADED